MKKQFMKVSKLILAMGCAAMLAALPACEKYDDEIDRLGDRVTSIESKLDAGKLVDRIVATATGFDVYYAGSATPVSIAVEGKKGEDGKTPTVTIDSEGYWLVNGERVLSNGQAVKAKGENGEAGKDGQDGQDGEAGKDGQDGKSPYVKEGFWYFYDDAKKEWVKADALSVNDIWIEDYDNYVVIQLLEKGKQTFTTVSLTKAAAVLEGIAFIPNLIDDGMNAIEVPYINAYQGGAKALFASQKIEFRMNPSTASIKDVAWSFIGREAVTRATGDTEGVFAAIDKKEVTAYGEGAYQFNLSVNAWKEPASGKTALLALQAEQKIDKSDVQIVSDYVKVLPVKYDALVAKKGSSPLAAYVASVPALATVADYTIVYNATTKTNLNDLSLAAAVPNGGAASLRKEMAQYGFVGYSLKYTNISYIGMDGQTDQKAFISIAENGEIEVLQGTAAISRTPVVKVEVLNASGVVLAVGYIKFEITATTPPPAGQETYTHNVAHAASLSYASMFKGAALSTTVGEEYINNQTEVAAVNWVTMNQIYTALGLSHDQFTQIYGPGATGLTTTITYNGSAVNSKIAKVNRSSNAPGVDTYAMSLNVTPYSKFGQNEVVLTLTPSNKQYKKLVVKFTYTVTKPTLSKEILEGYRYDNNAKKMAVKGINTGSGYQMLGYLGSAFSNGTSLYRGVFGTTNGKIAGAVHSFELTSSLTSGNRIALNGNTVSAMGAGVNNGDIDQVLGTQGIPASGVQISIPVTDKLKTATRSIAMDFKTTYINGEKDDFNFDVVFVNPLEIQLAGAANFTLKDLVNGQPDQLNLTPNYNVLFNGKRMVTGGTPETANGANTVNASDFVNLGVVTNGLFYALTPSTTYLTVSFVNPVSPNRDGLIQWKNGGITLTQKVSGGSVQVKFVTDFAEITKTADNLYIQPE